MAGYDKITRMLRKIPDELNRRLDIGWMGARLLEWLNSLPEVKYLLQISLANPGKSK